MHDGSHALAFAYVIACRTSRGAVTYVGWTLDPDRRLAEHNSGAGAKSTRGRVWAIIHIETFEAFLMVRFRVDGVLR